MNTRDGYFPVVLAATVLVLSLLLGILTRRGLLVRLTRLAHRTPSRADDVVVSSLARPLPVWFGLGGLYVALRFIPLASEIAPTIEKVLQSVLIVSMTFWLADLGACLLQLGGATNGTPPRTAGVVRHAVRIAVFTVGGLVLLNSLGISIAPILTTVGIGGLALALGLQETLANLFAGMQITLAGNIRMGDFVKLESGEEGTIDDIHWRTTRVRTLANNFVLVPNNRLAQSVVTNYYRPARDLAVLVELGVHYDSDLEEVERVTCDVARNVVKTVPGGIQDFEPFIRYHTFADSSINFTVILRAREFTDTFLIKHEFIKGLTRAYAAAGIVIPLPIRAINLDQEQQTSRRPGGEPRSTA